VAVGADAVTRRWPLIAPVVLALLVIGVPGNVRAFRDTRIKEAAYHRDARNLMLSFPRVPVARELPAWVRPIPEAEMNNITLGWLLDGVKSGRIPRPPPISAETRAAIGRQLEIEHYRQSIARACRQSALCLGQVRSSTLR
jgi:hypothetical protein